jgi:hypothetical protein
MQTNLIYDKGAYLHRLNERTGAQSYLLLPESNYRKQDSCFQQNPEFRATNGNIFNPNDPYSSMVAVESDLKNLQRKESKNPLTQYPYTKKTNIKPEVLPVCNKNKTLETKYTQLEAPSYKRELQIDIKRFQPLDRNLERLNRIQDNSYIGFNTRLQFRDAHKMNAPRVMNSTNQVNYGDNRPCHIPKQISDRKTDSYLSYFNKNEVVLPWVNCNKVLPNSTK